MKKFLTKILILIFICAYGQTAFAQEYRPAAIKKYNEGILYYNKKQYNNAIDCFLEAVKNDPNFPDSYYNLGILYEYTGERPKAIAAYKSLLKLDAQNPEAAYKIAQLYSRQNNSKVALNYLKLVPKNSPRFQSSQELKRKLTSTVAKQKTQYNIFAQQTGNVYDQISSPTGIIKDNTGNLYVSNFLNNSITVISPENEKRCFYKGSVLNGPLGLAVDGYNNIYVACYNSGKVIMVQQDGFTQTVLSNLSKPYCLFIDTENNLHVSEQGRNRVIKYKLY